MRARRVVWVLWVWRVVRAVWRAVVGRDWGGGEGGDKMEEGEEGEGKGDRERLNVAWTLKWSLRLQWRVGCGDVMPTWADIGVRVGIGGDGEEGEGDERP